MKDLLSDLLRTVRVEGSTYYRAELRGAFGIGLGPSQSQARFHLALSGAGYLALPDQSRGTHFGAGDVVLVMRGAPHVLCDRPGRPVIDLDDVKKRASFQPGQVLRHGQGRAALTVVCGEVSFAGDRIHPVLDALPGLLHARRAPENDPGEMQGLLALIDRETSAAQPGWMAIVDRLSAAVFIQVLRAWLGRQPDTLSVFAAMRDPLIGRAVGALHRDLARAWTLADLARVARMSRTRFSARFREVVGATPLRYLARCRIAAARELLAERELSIAQIAERVGYHRQAAFGKAFRELTGQSPGAYRAGLRPGPDP